MAYTEALVRGGFGRLRNGFQFGLDVTVIAGEAETYTLVSIYIFSGYWALGGIIRPVKMKNE